MKTALSFLLLLAALASCKKIKDSNPQPATGTLTINVPWGICNELISGSVTTGLYNIYVDRVTNNDPLNPNLEAYKSYTGPIRNNQPQINVSNIQVPMSGSYAITVEVIGACNICVNNCSGSNKGKPFYRKIKTVINSSNNPGGFVHIIDLAIMPGKCGDC